MLNWKISSKIVHSVVAVLIMYANDRNVEFFGPGPRFRTAACTAPQRQRWAIFSVVQPPFACTASYLSQQK